jgi:DNA-3-methyladenine glycosylase I
MARRRDSNDEQPARCPWSGSDPLYVAYHDQEWGTPSRDDRHLFEMLVLEGAQAGLSWSTILRKRANYRAAFDDFDPEQIARYDSRRIESLLQNSGIVRNRLKVHAAVTNARAYLDVVGETGTFHEWIWQFTGGQPVVNAWTALAQVPARTAESDAMSRALKRRGFSFVGSTICYAFMQAVGMVNDHLVSCFRYPQLAGHASRRGDR